MLEYQHRMPIPAAATAVADHPNRRLRFRVRQTRRALDDRLAEGAEIDGSAALSLRARQLSGPRERRAVAACLEHILDAADECQTGGGPHLVLDYTAVITTRAEILAVIELLRSDLAVDARGVALARVLVQRRTTPLAGPCGERTLAHAIAEIAQALPIRASARTSDRDASSRERRFSQP